LNGALKRDSTDERFLNLYDACKKLVDQYFTDPSLVHTRERWGRIVGESSLGDNDAKAECFYATEGITLSGSSSFLIENLCLSSNQKVEGASTPIIAGKNVSTGDLVKCNDWSTRALSARHEVDTIRRNIESGSINK
jgi:hypothetical protein